KIPKKGSFTNSNGFNPAQSTVFNHAVPERLQYFNYRMRLQPRRILSAGLRYLLLSIITISIWY
ncbi:MAG: hypothetical protein PHC69_04435, partial [Ruminiclostridium sp.]|nr:hypothetical protein [Ruminiclostridium sp.]